MIIGHCQNSQNCTFIRPYEPIKSGFKNYFHAKMNTTLLLYLYPIFIFLLGHPHFLCIFSSCQWRTFLRNSLYQHDQYQPRQIWTIPVISKQSGNNSGIMASLVPDPFPFRSPLARLNLHLRNSSRFDSWERLKVNFVVSHYGSETLEYGT